MFFLGFCVLYVRCAFTYRTFTFYIYAPFQYEMYQWKCLLKTIDHLEVKFKKKQSSHFLLSSFVHIFIFAIFPISHSPLIQSLQMNAYINVTFDDELSIQLTFVNRKSDNMFQPISEILSLDYCFDFFFLHFSFISENFFSTPFFHYTQLKWREKKFKLPCYVFGDGKYFRFFRVFIGVHNEKFPKWFT